MNKLSSPDSIIMIKKKYDEKMWKMAAISSIIGLLLFLSHIYLMSKYEGGGVWGTNLTIEYIFLFCSMLVSLSIMLFGAIFALIFFIDRVNK